MASIRREVIFSNKTQHKADYLIMRNKEVLYNEGKTSKHHNFMDSENELIFFFTFKIEAMNTNRFLYKIL